MSQIMSSEKETLALLTGIFHTQLLTMNLLRCDTQEKMMNMLRSQGRNDWTTEQILKLATDNKIEWVHGSDDPTPYDTYKKAMNARLAQILSE